MKKFFSTLFILFILAGLGAFFGWAQLGVPPDAYGIIRSKSHGTDPDLVKPGEFRWVWYKLIPTNATTTVFRIKPVTREFSAKGALPSGAVYQNFTGMEGRFAWEIRASLSFSLRPEALIPLVISHNTGTQEELARYQDDLAGQIEAFILRRVNLDEEFAGYLETLLKNGESPELEREIFEQFPSITAFSLQIKSAVLPDFALYRQAKELYENYVSLQREYMASDLEEQAKSSFESRLRLGELEQYGALLTKYPILLDYLAFENGGSR